MSAAVVELHDGYVGHLVHGNTGGGTVDDDEMDEVKRAKRQVVLICPSEAAGT